MRVDFLSSIATATASEREIVSRRPIHLFLSSKKRSTVLCLVLIVLTLTFYNPVVHNGFTNMDDNGYITENVHVRAGLTWETVKWAFTSFEYANWHPLTWLSHALDCQMFGLNPVGHHYINVLLHAVNALLLFLLLESATGFSWRSFMVAALFALHPVNVESVAWAAERKNVLSMLFFLLTLHAYGWYVRHESVRRYSLVASLFALGLMAKPEIITLPFVLLLWDYWPLRRIGETVSGSELSVLSEKPTERIPAVAAPIPRSFWYLLREKIPLMALAGVSAVLTLRAQLGGNAVRVAPFGVRFANGVVAYVRYIGKLFWPTRLAALYPYPARVPLWEVIACSGILLMLTALFLRWSDRRYLVVGWFWFLGTLVPVIGLVQAGLQAMADRYAYLPCIGCFVCLVWGVAEFAQKRRIPNAWLSASVVVILAALGAMCSHQIAYWHDSITLWRHALSVTQRNYFAHHSLAGALAEKGQVEEAIAEFDAAESFKCYHPIDLAGIAAYKRGHGHVQAAIDEYYRALEASPDPKTRDVILSELAPAFMQIGDFGRAKLVLAAALRENPNNAASLVSSGLLAERDGDFESAVAQITHAMQVEPTDVGYLLLGQALRRAGRSAEADDALAHAQRISHDLANAQNSAERVLTTAGIKND